MKRNGCCSIWSQPDVSGASDASGSPLGASFVLRASISCISKVELACGASVDRSTRGNSGKHWLIVGGRSES
jgi:hypothetical protein